jgi:hypothetical protein
MAQKPLGKKAVASAKKITPPSRIAKQQKQQRKGASPRTRRC